jgi:phosphatidylserine/phosphatidylglycerophosphate/cardiolipin synthase-like enzyme
MTTSSLQAAIKDSLTDFTLSKDEKYMLRELLQDYKDDGDILRNSRNYAFDLVKEHIRNAPEHHYETVVWLEKIVKTIDALNIQSFRESPSSHFSPGDSCADKIIALIHNAQSSIDICVFTISDNRISNEISKAHLRGVVVRIITDNDKSEDRGSDVVSLLEQGLSVRMDNTNNHMHHKFAIFDNKTLVNGSFNWTRSASKYNHENITVLHENATIQAFSKIFQSLWQGFESN